jgi:GNAT superfamily N-acetyltransferase
MNIAHPRFRNELLEWAKQKHIVPQEVLPFLEAEYPEDLKKYVTLKDGTKVLLRPIKPSDATLKQHLFYSLTKESVSRRFLGSLKAMPMRRVWPYVAVDYDNEMSIVVTVTEGRTENIVAIGSYAKIPHTTTAEVSFVVRDDWQNRGLGTMLFNHLLEIAKKKGVTGFTAWVSTNNTRMMHVFKKCGYPMRFKVEGDLYYVTIDLKE